MTNKKAVWILGDQLLPNHPALIRAVAECGKESVSVVVVEPQHILEKRPYHRKKLVLVLSAMRHYAAGLKQQGYNVSVVKAATFSEGLKRFKEEEQPDHLICMAAGSYRGRRYQQERLEELLSIPVDVIPSEQFLTAQYNPYPNPDPQRRYLLEYFYRKMRRHFNVLMAGDDPAGGQWNYDRENRKPLPRGKQPPKVITFEPDAITQQVIEEVSTLSNGIGTAESFGLAVTRDQALLALEDFIANRLGDFGPYEDAMASEHVHLYHSNLSAYLNLGLLEPMELIHSAEQAFLSGDAPINSVEGFVRQILGWREYIYWQYWRLMPAIMHTNFWTAEKPLPKFFWDGRSELNCLNIVIQKALQNGYNHHIERLMILCNFSLLSGLKPQDVYEWFSSIYIDAYEWVMVPNVIGMGLNADGGLIATKPYLASANYINRMSDYCANCYYDPKKRSGQQACPFNFLYWNFLIRNETLLRSNPRMGANVLGLRHLDEKERLAVQEEAQLFLSQLESTTC